MELMMQLNKKVERHIKRVSRELKRMLIRNHGVVRLKPGKDTIENFKKIVEEHPHWPMSVLLAEAIVEIPSASPTFLGSSLFVESEKFFKYHSIGYIFKRIEKEERIKLIVTTEEIKTVSHTFNIVSQINISENEEETSEEQILHG